MILILTPEFLTICRLAPDAPLPQWAQANSFFSITRTPDELSLIVPDADVPADITAERGWRAFKVAGQLDFALTGILASLVAPLAEAGIPIFALSTYDTDYILVKAERLTQAITALTHAGHHCE